MPVRLILHLVAALVLVTSCTTRPDKSGPFDFLHLRSGVEVEIHRTAIASSIHHSECTVRLRGGDPVTGVTRGIFDEGYRELGPIDAMDLTRLDAALSFYRKGQSRGVPSDSVQLQIRWFHDGVVVHEESLVGRAFDNAVQDEAIEFDDFAISKGVPTNKIRFIDMIPPITIPSTTPARTKDNEDR